MTVETTGVLEDCGNLLPRRHTFGLACGVCLAPARAARPRHDGHRCEQAGNDHGSLSNTSAFVRHLSLHRRCLVVWASLIERQVSGWDSKPPDGADPRCRGASSSCATRLSSFRRTNACRVAVGTDCRRYPRDILLVRSMVLLGAMHGAISDRGDFIPCRGFLLRERDGSTNIPPRREGLESSRELRPPEEAGVHKEAGHQGERERWEAPNDLHGHTPYIAILAVTASGATA
jgi:hypothetical protein